MEIERETKEHEHDSAVRGAEEQAKPSQAFVLFRAIADSSTPEGVRFGHGRPKQESVCMFAE